MKTRIINFYKILLGKKLDGVFVVQLDVEEKTKDLLFTVGDKISMHNLFLGIGLPLLTITFLIMQIIEKNVELISLLIVPSFFLLFVNAAKDAARDFMNKAKERENLFNIEEIKKYPYFYVKMDGSLVFMNHKPLLAFVFSTKRIHEKYRQSIFSRLFLGIWDLFYLRFVWPFILNPTQLSFLRYDKAAKKLNLKQGDDVLEIGCGAVPHHNRWKKRLGENGSITAIDNSPGVIFDSKRREWMIEFIRSIFNKKRWMSKHVCMDAFELKFEENSFDYVIAIRCYYVDIKECLKVLKPKGKVYIWSCGDVENLPKDAISLDDGYIIIKK